MNLNIGITERLRDSNLADWIGNQGKCGTKYSIRTQIDPQIAVTQCPELARLASV